MNFYSFSLHATLDSKKRGASLVTTTFTPTTEFSPTVTLGNITAPSPIHRLSSIMIGLFDISFLFTGNNFKFTKSDAP